MALDEKKLLAVALGYVVLIWFLCGAAGTFAVENFTNFNLYSQMGATELS